MNERLSAAAELERREAERELCERDLGYFFRKAWTILEPGTPLTDSWYFDVIAEHLTAVSKWQIQNLLISCPPGTAKSTMVSVVWPVWEWIANPQTRFLTAGNDLGLTTQFCSWSRDLIESDWFQDIWGDRFAIRKDRNQVTRYENDKRGFRLVRPVGGKVSGRRGSVIILDDPDDYLKVHSEAERKIVRKFWRAFYSRVSNPKKARRVVVGQRVHPDDLISYLLKSGEFENLLIRERHEPKRFVTTCLGWKDPRTEEGQWLRPERFSEKEEVAAINTYGYGGYKAQYQQEPEGADGTLFKEAWLQKRWRRVGSRIMLGDRDFDYDAVAKFATVDPAATANASSDYTVISVWCVSPWGDLVFLDCRRERLETPDQPEAVRQMYRKHNLRAVGVEKVLNQTHLFQYVQRMGIPTLPVSPLGKKKDVHAQRAIILAQTGKFWLPERGQVDSFPLDEVISEFLAFTGEDGVGHDDVCDSASYATDMMDMFIGSKEVPKILEVGKRPDTNWAQKGNVFGMGPQNNQYGVRI